MGLAPFDNTWYCDKCGERIKDEDDFIYCPKCGNVLKNDWYQMALQSIEKFLKNFSKNICEDCCEEFDEDYNFCPLCSNELKKEGIMKRVEKDNSIIADWNGEEVCVFDKDRFLSSPHFSGENVIKSFKEKNYFDNKLESDFKDIGEKLSQKLNYDETFLITRFETGGEEIRGIEFVPKLSEDILEDGRFKPEDKINCINNKDYNIILKIRENLYAKLKVETVVLY